MPLNPTDYHSLNWLSGYDDAVNAIPGATNLYPTGNSSVIDARYPALGSAIHQAQNAREAGDVSLADAFNARAAHVQGEQGSDGWWAGLAQVQAVSELPPPSPAEIPHPIDSMPTGTTITKTDAGFTVQKPGEAPVEHTGGFNAWLHKEWAWLRHFFGK